jgi:hypothetical protein
MPGGAREIRNGFCFFFRYCELHSIVLYTCRGQGSSLSHIYTKLVESFIDRKKIVMPKVSNMLDRLYSKFDELSVTHGVTKIDTIGDA